MAWPKSLDEVTLLLQRNKLAEASAIVEDFCQALEPHQRTKNIACLLMRGTLEFRRSPTAAVEFYEKALTLADQLPIDDFGKDHALSGLGACLWASGEYTKAKQHYFIKYAVKRMRKRDVAAG